MIKVLNGMPILCDEIGCTTKTNLDDLLQLGARVRVLINTHAMRGIGKTTALVEFAKKHDYLVVHPQADYIRKELNYGRIVNPYVLIKQQGLENKNVVIDEGVFNLKEITEAGCNIITGFCNFKSENEKSFDETIIDNLKNELESLTTKIQKTRDNHDFGTYKNLVLAYKEVLGLYQELVNGKTTQQDIVNYHVHVDKVTTGDAKEFINSLKLLSVKNT